MAHRPHGHAFVDSDAPRAWAVCDRCRMLYNHYALRWQYQWRGAALVNTNLLVCPTCHDIPAPFLRTFTLPPDPVPIQNPRPDLADLSATTLLQDESGADLIDEGGDQLLAE